MKPTTHDLSIWKDDNCPFDPDSGTKKGCHPASLRNAGSTLRQLKEKSEQLDVIHDLAILLLQRSSLEDVLWIVARSTIARLGFEDCVIYLVDANGSQLVQKAAFGPKNPYGEVILDPIIIPMGDGIVGNVAKSGQPERVDDTRKDARYIVDDQMRLSELAVPIVHEGTVIGVIDSEHTEADFYTDEHVELLTTIASIAANKIANALTIGHLNSTVAELRVAQEELRLERERYRALYDHHPSMFFVLDRQGVISDVNDFAQKQLGFQAAQLVGKELSDLGPDPQQVRDALSAACSGSATLHHWETRRTKRDGSVIHVRDTVRVIASALEHRDSILVVSEDVTDAYLMAQRLRYQASHDELTGLCNRREFERLVEIAIAECGDGKSTHAVLYLDLDQFKLINDNCGHAAGDELLRQLSDVLIEQVRRGDVVARLGGDEFGVLVRKCSELDAMRIAGAVRRAVEVYRFQWKDKILSVGASIGVVPLGTDSGTLAQVLAAADNACFGAKDAGRNRIHLYSEADEDIARRHQEMRFAVRLDEAIEEDRFKLFWQPISPVDVHGSLPRLCELLIRLEEPGDKLVLPNSFLPAAERYGVVPRLDRCVVGKALAWLSTHRSELHPDSVFCINLSGLSQSEPSFVRYLCDALA